MPLSGGEINPNMTSEFINETIVIDTDSRQTFVGTMIEADDCFIKLHDVCVYDAREAKVMQEEFLVECAEIGLPTNRDEILVKLDRIVAITRLSDIIIPGKDN